MLGACVRDEDNLVGYADDHCIYSCCKAGDREAEKNKIYQLSSSLDNIKQWMLTNCLKMNEGKTKFIIFGSSRSLLKCESTSIRVGNSNVEHTSCVDLLGMQLDEHLTFKEHIAKKFRAASYAMFSLLKLRRYLSRESCLQ